MRANPPFLNECIHNLACVLVIGIDELSLESVGRGRRRVSNARRAQRHRPRFERAGRHTQRGNPHYRESRREQQGRDERARSEHRGGGCHRDDDHEQQQLEQAEIDRVAGEERQRQCRCENRPRRHAVPLGVEEQSNALARVVVPQQCEYPNDDEHRDERQGKAEGNPNRRTTATPESVSRPSAQAGSSLAGGRRLARTRYRRPIRRRVDKPPRRRTPSARTAATTIPNERRGDAPGAISLATIIPTPISVPTAARTARGAMARGDTLGSTLARSSKNHQTPATSAACAAAMSHHGTRRASSSST